MRIACLERARRDSLLGRCLRGPSVVWRGRHRAHARSCRLSRGHRAATRLARRLPRLQETGAASAVFRHFARRNGLDGEQIHRQPPPALRRRLQPRRSPRLSPRIPHHRLYENPEAAVSRRARRAGRHRGQHAPPHPLRLLARPPAPLHSLRFGSRYDYLRNGRETDSENRRRTKQRIVYQRFTRHSTNGIPDLGGRLPAARGRHRAEQPRRLPARQAEASRELPPHRGAVEHDARPPTLTICFLPPLGGTEGGFRGRESALPAHDHRRARRLARPALHAPAPPEIQRENHSRL